MTLACVLQARHKQAEETGAAEPGPIATAQEIVRESGILVSRRVPAASAAWPKCADNDASAGCCATSA